MKGKAIYLAAAALLLLQLIGCSEDTEDSASSTSNGPATTASSGAGAGTSSASTSGPATGTGGMTTASTGGMTGVGGGGGNGGMGGNLGQPIPNPGSGTANWITNTTNGTPSTAFPVGIVTASPGYIQGNIDPNTGNFFFVFQTGPNFTNFSVQVFAGFMIDYVHVHEGANMMFGPQVPPVTSTNNSGTWTLLPNTVYVLEVHSTGGTFF